MPCEWGGSTCEKLFLDLIGVEDGCGDAGHGADHAAQTEVDEHEEEHYRPERRRREMGHGLCEGDEGQAGALNRLQGDIQRTEIE